jgi:hypothetical protein
MVGFEISDIELLGLAMTVSVNYLLNSCQLP